MTSGASATPSAPLRETDESKIFPNEAFGYWKVTVERPLRLTVDLSPDYRQRFRAACRDAKEEPLANVTDQVGNSAGRRSSPRLQPIHGSRLWRMPPRMASS